MIKINNYFHIKMIYYAYIYKNFIKGERDIYCIALINFRTKNEYNLTSSVESIKIRDNSLEVMIIIKGEIHNMKIS